MALEDPSQFFVYILRCADGSYYVGHAADVAERVTIHNEGRGARLTACRVPVVLVYQESFSTEAEAVQRELQLKGWSQAKKQALIVGDLSRLKQLSKRRRWL